MTSLDLLGSDPLITSWLVAFGLLFLVLVAIPLLRTAVAGVLFALACFSGRTHWRNVAARVLPQTARAIGGVLLGSTTVLAPAMAEPVQPIALESVDLDRVATARAAIAPRSAPTAATKIENVDLDRGAATADVPTSAPSSTTVYLVRTGDTLWDIAAAQLDEPNNVEITKAWKAVWQANRVTVGEDPGHIYPGELLDLGVLA